MSLRKRSVTAGLAAVLVVAGAVSWVWWNHWGTAAQQTRSATLSGGDTGVVAIALTVLAAVAGWWGRGWQRERQRRTAIHAGALAVDRRGSLPLLGRIDLELLGVRQPRESSRAQRPQLPYAGRHELDSQLREALQLHRFVLVTGPSTAGKSRSTAHAARALYPDRPVLVPERSPGRLDKLLDEQAVPEHAVIWLDDLDRHLDREGLTATTVRRLLAIDAVRIVATMREAAYEQYKPSGEIRPAGRDVIDLAKEVDFTDWDDVDRAAAAEQFSGMNDVVTALNTGLGLGEYLSAGPELVERLERGAPPPEGVAVVHAAADWYRAGMTRPIPLDVLRQLYPGYLPEDDRSLLERFNDGLRWACLPVSGARMITDRTDRTGVSVHDYLLDHLSATLPTGLPPHTWDELAAALASSPDDLRAVGIAAYLTHQESAVAERFLHAAAAQGDVRAMSGLGSLLEQRGDVTAAERWYRPAAETGQAGAMTNLGVLLEQRGEVAEAERWYRAGTAAGSARAMNNLGSLLKQRGEVAEAERWYRAGAEAGDDFAMANLGYLLEGRGEVAEAERWYRAGAEAGDDFAMAALGDLLEQRGEVAEAERWYRAGTAAGNARAFINLSRLDAARKSGQ